MQKYFVICLLIISLSDLLTMKFHLCLLYFMLFCVSMLSAQAPYTTEKTAPEKLLSKYRDAAAYYQSERTNLAIEVLGSVLKKDSTFIDAHIMLGFAYFDNQQFNESVICLQRAVRIDPNYSPRACYMLARALQEAERYEEAGKYYEQYLTLLGINEELASKARKNAANCYFAALAMQNPVPFDPKSMGDSANTFDPEYLPCLTADGETVIFTRRRDNRNEDFYRCRKKDGVWLRAEPMSDINTLGNEGAQSISADGNTLVFTACDRRDSKGGCDLYLSEKKNGRWTLPVNIGAPVNTSAWETQPAISADGQVLYFVSNRAGGKGESDIYATRRFPSGKWGAPINLGDTINTPLDDICPFFHADGQTLYFVSEGHIGMGGRDIYFSRRLPSGRWGIPENLGYPVNTKAEEASLVVSLDGKTGYFASDRDSKGGTLMEPNYSNIDLYSFDLYEAARPKPVTYVRATVRDAITKMPLVALAEVMNLTTSRKHTSDSTETDGVFLVCLPLGQDFALNVSKSGYLFYSENFSLSATNTLDKPYLLDIYLMPIGSASPVAEAGGSPTPPPANKPVVLKNVFFDTGSTVLRPESNTELNVLKTLLVDNPTLRIQINGHTDNVGADTDNLRLSEGRAKAVFEYLVQQGISSDRMQSRGFGETVPINSNDTPEGRQQNRRTEFEVVY